MNIRNIKFSPFLFRNITNNNFYHAQHFHKTSYTQQNRIVAVTQKLVPMKLEETIDFWMKKYQDLFGLTKLEELHAKVLEVKAEIQDVQEKRRKIQEDIFITQKKLQESHDILHKVSIGDDMYLTLVTQVRDLLKEQKRLQEVFSLYDQTEREYQTNLALAINSSQDHERTHREKHKYLSIISGAVCGLFCFFVSSAFNWYNRKGIKSSFSDIQENIKLSSNNISENLTLRTNDISNQVEELKNHFISQQQTFEGSVKDLELILNNKMLITDESDEDMYLDMQVKQILHNLEGRIDSKLKFHSTVNLGLFTSFLLISSVLLYLGNSH